jgi:tetratricopeptide (TPR) repeat protein/tRNA A-37 threonylcarbamoyl transferase component Bud32
MGEVYLGRDRVLDRPVAVKVIRPRDPELRNRSMYEASFREAFLQEARIGANLTHPAIATVFDFGFHEEEPFIVFEYIAGETLHEVIRRRGHLPLEEVRLLLGPLAQALDFAHSHQVVHRDLKPENIRATAQGHFKILDLGLAREFRDGLDWSFAGTPAYASPEQVAGLPCDGRTDQYALALVAYEMLTGERVFAPTDWDELLKMHREEELPDPRRCVPDLPRTVCTALWRALQKDPNHRYASCQEFALAVGCQLQNAPLPLPEILRLTAVRRMWGQWNSARFRLIRKGTAVYLALSADALWVAYRGEIRRWPLGTITAIRRNLSGTKLHLQLHPAQKVAQQSFRFTGWDECGQWYKLLRESKDRLPAKSRHTIEAAHVEPVVLMRSPPRMRYQALGAVEFQEASRQRAEAGLQLRAAMMGADAVVDVQHERLPQLGRTVHRHSGMAIRAVDTAGRREFRARWFATQVSQLSSWMLLLLGVSFLATLFGSLLFFALNLTGIGNPVAPGESTGQRLGQVVLLVVLIHSWPLILALLTRWLLWPQLLRPTGLALLAVGAKPLAGLVGWLGAGIATGQWVGGTVFWLFLLDPINLGIFLFAWFLCQRAWRAYGEYRVLAPDAEQAVPSNRRVGGRLSLVTSILFATLLGSYLAWGQYDYVSHFAFPGNAAWKERQALKDFNEGLAKMPHNAPVAESAFRKVLPLWQELIDADPSRPEYRWNLAATHTNLGILLIRQQRIAEAEKSYRQALAHYEKLDMDFPAFRQHKKDHELTRQQLTQLLILKRFLEEAAAEDKEGRRLQDRGQYQEAAAYFRQALARHEQRRKEFADHALFVNLLAIKQNELAWFLVMCADENVRNPQQAVDLARQAVKTAPQEGTFWNTLGAAHYRAGNWKQCLEALEKSTELRQGGDAFDWLFMAMAFHRLRKPAEANTWLDKAVQWMAQAEQGKLNNPLQQFLWQSHRREADLLRGEAEKLIRPKPEARK